MTPPQKTPERLPPPGQVYGPPFSSRFRSARGLTNSDPAMRTSARTSARGARLGAVNGIMAVNGHVAFDRTQR